MFTDINALNGFLQLLQNLKYAAKTSSNKTKNICLILKYIKSLPWTHEERSLIEIAFG